METLLPLMQWLITCYIFLIGVVSNLMPTPIKNFIRLVNAPVSKPIPSLLNSSAVWLDNKNGNTLWQEFFLTIGIQMMSNYLVFDNMGKNGTCTPGYKRICCHTIYDVKHNGRHLSQLVGGGHLTPVPDQSIYSAVVSLWFAVDYFPCLFQWTSIVGRWCQQSAAHNWKPSPMKIFILLLALNLVPSLVISSSFTEYCMAFGILAFVGMKVLCIHNGIWVFSM